jgi:hypothetical protein
MIGGLAFGTASLQFPGKMLRLAEIRGTSVLADCECVSAQTANNAAYVMTAHTARDIGLTAASPSIVLTVLNRRDNGKLRCS